ncbi:hypothetical protein VPH35_136579 [Triticum aestivum]
MTSPTDTTTRNADHVSSNATGLGSIDQFKVCVILGSGAAPAAAQRCSGSICILATRQLEELRLHLHLRRPSSSRCSSELSILSDIAGPNSVLLEKVITIASSTGPNSVLKNLLRWHLFRLCRHSLKLVTFHGKGGSNKTMPSLEGSVDT